MKSRKVMIGLVMGLLVMTVFSAMGRAENYGYWSSGASDVGEDAYMSHNLWRTLWTKSMTRVFTRGIYVYAYGEHIKLGTAVVTIYPVWYIGSSGEGHMYLFINAFIIYNAGDYYKDTLPVQRNPGEAWWIHHVNFKLTLDSNRNNKHINAKFDDDQYAVKTGYWEKNYSSRKAYPYEFILSGGFSGNAYSQWKQKLKERIEDETEKEYLNDAVLGVSVASGAFSLAEVALDVGCPVIGIPLTLLSIGSSLYGYYANTDDFDYKSLSPGIDTTSHRYITELSYDFTPAGNPNTKYYWAHYNWPFAVNAWTYAWIDVRNWAGDSQEKFTFDFSAEFTSMQPNHQNQNVNVGFSYPIVLKNKSGYDVENEYTNNDEIFPKPTDMWIVNPAEGDHNHVYKGEPFFLRISVPHKDVVSYMGTPRMQVNFGDGRTLDIPVYEDVYSQDNTQTVFEMAHTWNSAGSYTVTSFLYLNDPEEVKGYYGDTLWEVSWYIGVWVSGIKSATIVAIKDSGSPPPGGGACPFLYTYDGSWHAKNNVLVWAENATRRNLETRDYYLLRNLQEINGTVKIGIGEFGEDVDFIDDVKLYRVNVPNEYNVVESYNGKVYAYKDFEVPERAEDSNGRNVSYLINSEDNNYWVGNKGENVDVFVNLSKKNLLLFRGIDNPPSGDFSLYWNHPVTLSTIWLYGNLSGNWVKLKEIKVRHNLHTVAINMNKLIHKHRGMIELRFIMKDRNGIDFIGIAHEFKKVRIKRVKLTDTSRGFDYLKHRDGWYLRINPGEFVSLDFKGRGSGTYLVKIDGFYFNSDKIGKGIGIVRENETNIAEAELQKNITSDKGYALLPLLNNYSGVSEITWFVDGYYLPGEKPIVEFSSGGHFIELYIMTFNGDVEEYSTSVNAI